MNTSHSRQTFCNAAADAKCFPRLPILSCRFYDILRFTYPLNALHSRELLPHARAARTRRCAASPHSVCGGYRRRIARFGCAETGARARRPLLSQTSQKRRDKQYPRAAALGCLRKGTANLKPQGAPRLLNASHSRQTFCNAAADTNCFPRLPLLSCRFYDILRFTYPLNALHSHELLPHTRAARTRRCAASPHSVCGGCRRRIARFGCAETGARARRPPLSQTSQKRRDKQYPNKKAAARQRSSLSFISQFLHSHL